MSLICPRTSVLSSKNRGLSDPSAQGTLGEHLKVEVSEGLTSLGKTDNGQHLI
jgi:hypothetical protein